MGPPAVISRLATRAGAVRAAGRQGHAVSRGVGRLVTLACLLLSFLAFISAIRLEEHRAGSEFERLTQEALDVVKNRFAGYAQVLEGAAAHVAAQGRTDGQVLETYVRGLTLERDSPGILGIGFIEAVPAHDATAIAVHGGRTGVISFDPDFLSLYREVLVVARDSGEAILLPNHARLTGTEAVPDYMMLRAVRDTRARAGGEDFLGWVVAPVSGAGAFASTTDVTGRALHMSVVDITRAAPHTPVFSTADAGEAAGRGRLERRDVIPLHGLAWSVGFASTPAFDAAHQSAVPEMSLVLGLMLTALVRLVLRSAARHTHGLRRKGEQRARAIAARERENCALRESGVAVVFILDGSERIIFANDAAAALFECARGSFAGKPFGKFVQGLGAVAAEEPGNAEGLRACGARLALDVERNSWRGADGAPRTTVLIRDVTGQTTARKTIEALHKRYDVALTGAGIGIFEVDLVTGTAEMSDTWHKIMGTDRLDVPFDHKVHFLGRVHPADLPSLQAADRECITGRTRRSVAEYRVRFGGEWRWMYSDAVPVARGPDGHATRLIGTQSDITALRHGRNALEASEALFRMVLEDAPLAMAVLDEQGAFVSVNAALSKLSGHDPGKLRHEMRLADLLSRRDFIQMSRDMRGLLTSGAAKTYQNQFPLRTGDGEARWCLFNLSWTFDKNRAQNVYIAQIVDISEQKRVERIKSEFVATVSHELRTPLTSIKGAIGILDATSADTLTPDARRLLNIACINADRLALIVNDILDLERISSGDVVFEYENTCLNDILVYALGEMQECAREHGNRLALSQTDQEIWVHVDAGRIRQVVCNLLSNACKYSDPGTVVEIQCELRDQDARICVINTGAPVPERFRETVFEPFTQLENSDTRSRGGTGLGLNIVRQIVLRSNGQVGLEQRRPRETVFWFTVPLPIADVTGKHDAGLTKRAAS